MSVNKKLLEQKSNYELLKYVQPESRFTRLAVQYAYEILTARGHSFTPEETDQINFLLRDKEKREEIYIHANHTQGATLMYVCAGLSVLNMIATHNDELFGGFIFIKVMAVIFLAGMGLLISRGISQVKYVLIVNQLLGVFFMVPLLFLAGEYPVMAAMALIQSALQVYVIVLLFTIPK